MKWVYESVSMYVFSLRHACEKSTPFAALLLFERALQYPYLHLHLSEVKKRAASKEWLPSIQPSYINSKPCPALSVSSHWQGIRARDCVSFRISLHQLFFVAWIELPSSREHSTSHTTWLIVTPVFRFTHILPMNYISYKTGREVIARRKLVQMWSIVAICHHNPLSAPLDLTQATPYRLQWEV